MIIQWRVFLSKGCPLEPVKSIPIDKFRRTPEDIKSKKEKLSLYSELSYTEIDSSFEKGIFIWRLLLLFVFLKCKPSINLL